MGELDGKGRGEELKGGKYLSCKKIRKSKTTTLQIKNVRKLFALTKYNLINFDRIL